MPEKLYSILPENKINLCSIERTASHISIGKDMRKKNFLFLFFAIWLISSKAVLVCCMDMGMCLQVQSSLDKHVGYGINALSSFNRNFFLLLISLPWDDCLLSILIICSNEVESFALFFQNVFLTKDVGYRIFFLRISKFQLCWDCRLGYFFYHL